MARVRLIDLIGLLVVAVVVFLPHPSINAYPAVQGDKTDLDRLSLLQDALYRQPNDVGTAVELSRAYLAVDQPGWALATLRQSGDPKSYQVHQVAAYAYATLLAPQRAHREAELGLTACEADPQECSDVARIRLGYLAEMMGKLVTAGIDPRSDPSKAKRLVSEALHATKASAEK